MKTNTTRWQALYKAMKKRSKLIYFLYTEMKQSRMIQWYSFYTQESLENNPDCNGDFTGLDINVLNDND